MSLRCPSCQSNLIPAFNAYAFKCNYCDQHFTFDENLEDPPMRLVWLEYRGMLFTGLVYKPLLKDDGTCRVRRETYKWMPFKEA